MKKQVWLFILLISVLAQAGGNALLLLQYRLNKEYIAAQYCINKEQPQLGCEGSCHLKKQLNQLDDTAAGKQQQLELVVHISWICQHAPAFRLTPAVVATSDVTTRYTSFYRSLSGKVLEHPPQFFMLA